jgi:acetaldehyde dehydrogenase
MSMSAKIQCAIIGSGNIGTDLMIKVMRMSDNLEMGAMVGIDPASDGLARAARLGNVRRRTKASTACAGCLNYGDIRVVFDATSAQGACRQRRHPAQGRQEGRRSDAGRHRPLHRARRQLDENLDEPNVNMVTCGGQATIPIVTPSARQQARRLWRDRRLHLVEIGGAGHARQYRRVHRNDIAGDRTVGGASAARRSSSSIRPNRR